FGFCESAQCGVQGLRTGHVNRRIRVSAGFCGVDHLGVLVWCGKCHESSLDMKLRTVVSLANATAVLSDPGVHGNTSGTACVGRACSSVLGDRECGFRSRVNFFGESGAFLSEHHDARSGEIEGLDRYCIIK